MKAHEDIQADLPLFALGSLDAEDRRAVEQHLTAGCDACEHELAEWRQVVDLIPLGLESTPIPDLKGRLLNRARVPGATGRVLPLRRWIAVPLGLAAAALLAFAGWRDTRLRSKLESEQQITASLRRELQSSESRMEEIRRVLAGKENDLTALRAALSSAQQSLAILQTRGLQMVRLERTPDSPPAEGHVIMAPEADRALFYAFDLPPIGADKTYELWWITEKEGPVNAGVFVPSADGLGRVEPAIPSGVGAIQAAAVTIEPAGGRPKPTGPMVLLGKRTGA